MSLQIFTVEIDSIFTEEVINASQEMFEDGYDFNIISNKEIDNQLVLEIETSPRNLVIFGMKMQRHR